MVNRVLLDANGLKVSRAGFNVLTASEAQLQFNSHYSAVSILMRGSFSPGNKEKRTINFGNIFPSSPPVFFLVGARRYVDYPDNQDWGWRYTQHIGTFSQSDSDDIRYFANVYNNRFEFTNDDNDTVIVRYVVWDYDL